MSATALDGDSNLRRVAWRLERNREGHRTYHVTWCVSADVSDGPSVIMSATGLPAIGSTWNYGGADSFAYCLPTMNVTHAPGVPPGHPARLWHVEQTFSTIPMKRCQDESIEDPLLEPQDVSGSFVKYTQEITTDRYGTLLKTSSHQPLQGPDVEFPAGNPTVRVSQNVAALGLSTFASMYLTVNDDTLWGLATRTILLSNVSWQRLIYGTCDYYYKRTFDFDIDYGTWDRQTPDYSNMCIKGDWNRKVDPPVWTEASGVDEDNPQDFMRFKDVNGENCRVLLNGYGRPLSGSGTGTGTGDDIVYIDIEHFDESNFLTLGIPTSF